MCFKWLTPPDDNSDASFNMQPDISNAPMNKTNAKIKENTQIEILEKANGNNFLALRYIRTNLKRSDDVKILQSLTSNLNQFNKNDTRILNFDSQQLDADDEQNEPINLKLSIYKDVYFNITTQLTSLYDNQKTLASFKRRIRSKQINYFDFNPYGIIMIINPIKRT